MADGSQLAAAPKEHPLARFTGILGILSVLAAAWLFSTDRRRIRWRTVAWGIGLQFCFAFLVLRFSFGQIAMRHAGDAITQMLSATFAGTQVLFGELGLPNSGAFGRIISPNSGAIFAFQVLPTIIFISAFFAVLYHIGLMQQDHPPLRLDHAQNHAHLRRRMHERRGQHLHGPDRSTAHHPAVPSIAPPAPSSCAS